VKFDGHKKRKHNKDGGGVGKKPKRIKQKEK
jgi:hypothetical protein